MSRVRPALRFAILLSTHQNVIRTSHGNRLTFLMCPGPVTRHLDRGHGEQSAQLRRLAPAATRSLVSLDGERFVWLTDGAWLMQTRETEVCTSAR
jgi:hypothetical protein